MIISASRREERLESAVLAVLTGECSCPFVLVGVDEGVVGSKRFRFRVAVLDVKGRGWDGPDESFMDRDESVSAPVRFCVFGRGAIFTEN